MFVKCVKLNKKVGKNSIRNYSNLKSFNVNHNKASLLFNNNFSANTASLFTKTPFSFQIRQNNSSSLLQTSPILQSAPLLPLTPNGMDLQINIRKNNENNDNNGQTNGKWKYLGIGFAFAVSFALFVMNDDNEAEETKENPLIWKIVLTGGPCGGKSTAMSAISQRLKSLGYDVYVVPEVATIVITGGLSFADLSTEQFLRIETNILRLQEFLEDTFTRLASARGKPSVILCDRGLCDNKAYLPKGSFEILLDEEGLKITDIRDKRYDAVFHLVTAAIGAEEFYTLANNTARSESPEQARELDYRVLDSWVGHPKLKIIDNSSDFKTKINRVVDGICRIVGAPSLLGCERKFKVNSFSIPLNITTESFDVDTDVIILEDGSQARLVKRSQKGSSTYIYTSQSNISGHEAVVERQITGREYLALRKQVQTSHQTVTKRITHFVWDGLYYSLNEYTSPKECEGIRILEVETSSKDHKFIPPPFIYLGDEITDNEKYSTYAFAMKKE